MNVIGLLSSLPAQAASAIGSIRLATRFADILNCNPSIPKISRFVLDRPPMKGNLQLHRRRYPTRSGAGPTPWGEMAWAGPDIRKTPRGQCGVRPAWAFSDCRQPRLAGWVKCLAATFEDLCCTLFVAIFL